MRTAIQTRTWTLPSINKADLNGGLLAAIIGLPTALAFGVQSGLGAQAGLYCAIILPIVAALVGGTRTLISDPTGPMTVIAATVVTMALAQNGDVLGDKAWALIIATFVLGGVFQLVLGLLNVGKYVKFLPYPVLSGFMTGIGVIIIAVQLFPLMGLESPKGFVNIMSSLPAQLPHANGASLALGGLTIALIYIIPRFTKILPSILVALIAVTLLNLLLGLEVPTLGVVSSSMPEIRIDALASLSMEDFDLIWLPALMLGGLGMIDSLLTSVVADKMTKTKHDSRRTVVGQGIGNILVGLLGGIPGAGSTVGTVTNVKSGATSIISGLSKGIFLLVIVALLAQFLQYIPLSVLAGILITIGIGIIDAKGLKMLRQVSRSDALVWAIVLFVTLFDNLLDAVAVGFILSTILFIVKFSSAFEETIGECPLNEFIGKHRLPEDLSQQIYVETVRGPMFFGLADDLKYHFDQLHNVKAVIIRMKHVPFLDQTGVIVLEESIRSWQDEGIQVYMTNANRRVKDMLEKVGIVPALVPRDHFYQDFDECVERITRVIEKNKNLAYEEALCQEHIF